jgi:enoyl-CoA hydratase/carnithine racemase
VDNDYVVSSGADNLLVQQEAGLVRILLSRPERRNAVSVDMMQAMLHVLEQCDDSRVRAVVVTGVGSAFCSGGDLQQRKLEDYETSSNSSAGVDGSRRANLELYFNPVISKIREIGKPVIAAVNGPAIGFGCSLALCCDLVYATQSAFFALPFANIGLIPDGGASVWVPSRVGTGRALEMAMFGERVSTKLAYEWGLINEWFPDDTFTDEVSVRAAKLAAGATSSYAGIKQLINARVYRDYPEQLRLETDLQLLQTATEDFREGITAFREGRAPVFNGRPPGTAPCS